MTSVLRRGVEDTWKHRGGSVRHIEFWKMAQQAEERPLRRKQLNHHPHLSLLASGIVRK